jgi:hypothetical protein
MKWLSFIEAYYFSPFGDVNNDNNMASNGSLGADASCTWHPWVYNDRIKVADKVTLKKGKLESKKVSEATKRNQVLNCIREQGSRQESEPIIGKHIDLGMAEPLHKANYAWGYIHLLILKIALSKSKIDAIKFHRC